MAYQPTLSDLPPPSQAELNYASSVGNGPQSGGYQPTVSDLPPPTSEELALGNSKDDSALGRLKDYFHQQIETLSPDNLKSGLKNLSILGRSGAQGLREVAEGIPGEAALNVLTGPSRAASSLGILPKQIQDYVGKNTPEETLQRFKDAPSLVTPQESQTSSGQLGEFIGGTVPLMAIPGADISKAPEFVERAVADAGPIARQLGLMGGRLGKGALVGAGTTAIAQPDDDVGKSLESGAAIGAATSGALSALGSSGKIAAKGLEKFFGGFGKTKDIKATLNAMNETGISLPAGEILESGPMAKLQRSLVHLPLSGIKKSYVNASAKVKDRMEDLITKMQDTGSSEAQEKVRDNLIKLSKDHHKTQKDLYAKTLDYGEEKGYRFSTPSYNNVLDTEIGKIQGKLDRGRSLSPEDKSLKKSLKEIRRGTRKSSRLVSADGTPFPPSPNSYRYDDAKFEMTDLRDKKDAAVSSGDNRLAGVYGRLEGSFRSDLKDNINATGDSKLIKYSNEADKFHKEQIQPLRTKEMLKFIHKKADSDTLFSTFLKTGQVERPKLLNQLVSKMKPGERDAMAANFLTRNLKSNSNEFDFNPASIATNYQKLKPAMKKILFDDKKRRELDNLSRIMNKVGGKGNKMFLPKTGVTWTEQAMSLAPYIAVGTGAAFGHRGIALAGVLGAIGAGKAMSSPKLAESYIKLLEKGGGLSQETQRHLSALPFIEMHKNKEKKK